MDNQVELKNLEQNAEQYSREWYEMMVTIWKDKLEQLGVFDTGTLYQSVEKGNLLVDGMSLTAVFQFMDYGIYIDAGTGRCYDKGNDGNLEFLDQSYRYEHKLGQQRTPKRWFSPSWSISVEVIKEKMADIAGEAFVGCLDNLD